MENRTKQNYRGIKPAHIVLVLEGNGKDIPFQEVQYVVEYEYIGGVTRMRTAGKIVQLTEEEKSWFN